MLTARRGIDHVPGLFVSLLKDRGCLPRVPREPRRARGFRFPGIAEMMDLEWMVAWGPRGRLAERGFAPAAGLCAYRDTYDFHTASDVREIVYLAGSPRAVVALLSELQREARAAGRRAIGAFDIDNVGLARALGKLGALRTRVVYEDAE